MTFVWLWKIFPLKYLFAIIHPLVCLLNTFFTWNMSLSFDLQVFRFPRLLPPRLVPFDFFSSDHKRFFSTWEILSDLTDFSTKKFSCVILLFVIMSTNIDVIYYLVNFSSWLLNLHVWLKEAIFTWTFHLQTFIEFFYFSENSNFWIVFYFNCFFLLFI